jgi:hypothetical protein
MKRENRIHESSEICPFSNEYCLKVCGLYDRHLEGCSIRIGAYNMYVLSKNIKKWIEYQENN